MLLTDRRNVVISVVRIRCSWEKKNRVVARCDNLKFLNYYQKKKKATLNHPRGQTQVSSFSFLMLMPF